MLAHKHTRNAHLFSDPSDQAATGAPAQDALARTPLRSTTMKVFLSRNGPQDPKQANRNDYGQLALSPQAWICPPPLLCHHPMVTSLLNWSKVIIWPMKDGDGKRTFKFGPIVTMSCHPWDSNAKRTPRKPTPGPSGTQWSKDLFQQLSQRDEPPIPGPSPSSKPPEDIATHEPEPEVAPTQSMEQLFGPPATPRSIIIIENTPVRSPTPPPSTPVPPPSTETLVPSPDLPPISAKNPTTSSSHSYNDARQEFTNL
ncbi:hypothetical protein O181_034431 [Austropuccinia psidii MF-1]|uniref:Uncharacterized protein n=1 Tax=Austropuccinia psidii MF-1 TaxID=1389203 RepID=A0A9Q3D0P2_9BASI|nr:hypothetical protein [Austropuccinia psidii MF-1]